jgi:hypothetical protein
MQRTAHFILDDPFFESARVKVPLIGMGFILGAKNEAASSRPAQGEYEIFMASFFH